MLCETRLNEILSGIAPIETVDEEQIAEAPGWIVSVAIDPLDRKTETHSTSTTAPDIAGLAAIRVTVAREAAEGRKNRGFHSRPLGTRSERRPFQQAAGRQRTRSQNVGRCRREPVNMYRIRRLQQQNEQHARAAGFTLLEVLLTAILSATLMAGLWSLFGTYLRLFETGQVRVERSSLLCALDSQFTVDLQSVVPPQPEGKGTSTTGFRTDAKTSDANFLSTTQSEVQQVGLRAAICFGRQ